MRFSAILFIAASMLLVRAAPLPESAVPAGKLLAERAQNHPHPRQNGTPPPWHRESASQSTSESPIPTGTEAASEGDNLLADRGHTGANGTPPPWHRDVERPIPTATDDSEASAIAQKDNERRATGPNGTPPPWHRDVAATQPTRGTPIPTAANDWRRRA